MKDSDAKQAKIIDAFIGETPLFNGLPREQLEGLSRIAVNSIFRRGDTIFSEGDDADGFYILRTGRVKIFKLSFEGKEQILHIIGLGEPFGEAPVFSGGTFPAHAEALEESRVIFFSKRAFIELIKKDPSIALNMLAILSRRLKQFTGLVENLSLKEVPQRLASYFLFMSNSKENEDSLELDMAKGQLANILGTIPETLSRILSKMVNQGLIRVQGRTIKLIDKKGLEEVATGEKVLQ
jgi:CRP-like cAMP-binding protein